MSSVQQIHSGGGIADLENLRPVNLKLDDGYLPIDSKSGAELVRNAVCDIRDAITLKPDGTSDFRESSDQPFIWKAIPLNLMVSMRGEKVWLN